MRIEKDYLGEESVPEDAYYGLATVRASKIYDVSGYRWQRVFIKSIAQVKQAALQTIKDLGYMEENKADALLQATQILESGQLDQYIIVDPLQGGAGTATNFNINEVLANKALEILGYEKGRYDIIHPIDDVNKFQSTNDVFPTASRLAIIYALKELEAAVEKLQSSLQEKEKEFVSLVKAGRTQYQDAVPISLGMEFSAFAEAIARDRWRIFKSFERIKVINLGGTAVGTGITAPRRYIFKVSEQLRKITGLGIARAENMVEATSNADVYSEVSGIMRSHAVNLIKIGNDLRFLSSSLCREITLKPLIRGSSIMPGKINPVIPELMVQSGLKVLGNDTTISYATSQGHLELNPFLPLITYTMLESLELLQKTDLRAVDYCIRDIKANPERIRQNLYSSQALLTVLLPYLGCTRIEEIWNYMQKNQLDLVQANQILNFMPPEKLEELLNPYNLLRLGEVDI
ncbi:aspartate ammonia-lyase [Thermosyntropha sp.]|uniref:aspartate ammonia-lyase n=1 Tax=Thermosyntropha sp. TaxID=2740820 RepID=UPI0025CC26A9|nr:aspartate ammonia-lyase [Thermosyntropha sp.]MBO8158908.1 aspartate ammonia-lyase [Thermosyntropha sp.]